MSAKAKAQGAGSPKPRPNKSASPQGNQSEAKAGRGKTTALWILAGVGLGAVSFAAGALAVGTDYIPRNTHVFGYDIGGMSRAEATDYLAEVFQAREQTAQDFVVDEEQTLAITPETLGVQFDAAATVEAAAEPVWNPVEAMQHITGEVALAPVYAVDEAKVEATMASMADTVARDPKNPSIAYDDAGQPQLTPGKTGRALVTENLPDLLVTATLDDEADRQLEVDVVQPEISEETATQVFDTLAVPAVAAPVTVTVEGTSAQLSPEAIAQALTFKVKDDTFVPKLDGDVLRDDIKDVVKKVEKKGKDATFKISDGKPVIVPSEEGIGVSPKNLSKAVLPVLEKSGSERTAAVSWGKIEPEFTTEDAQKLQIVEKLSSYTQGFPTAAYRTQNIGQAAKYINGTLLKPGEVFSLNETLRERTRANGYTEGAAICGGGVFCQELGGGVSTSATATWVAAFYAGMEREHVQAHSRYISRYQAGLEATVNWGSFDMSFKNPYETGVFITSHADSSSITVTFWGKKYYDEITAESGPRTNYTSYSTQYNTTSSCSSQSGVDGFSIVVTRVFWKDGERVREEPIKTVYQPTPNVVCGKSPQEKAKDKAKADAERKKEKEKEKAEKEKAKEEKAKEEKKKEDSSKKKESKPKDSGSKKSKKDD